MKSAGCWVELLQCHQEENRSGILKSPGSKQQKQTEERFGWTDTPPPPSNTDTDTCERAECQKTRRSVLASNAEGTPRSIRETVLVYHHLLPQR